MPFAARTPTIQLGDVVIVYVNPDEVRAVVVAKDEFFQNRFGTFHHNDIVGRKWGSKLATRNDRGFVHLLEPTPELWTLALPHRTQILYYPDISLITSFLDLQPGIKMIEAGTGSGSFSHAVARTVAPTGRVHSFEFHAGRAEIARKEFETHELSDIISVEHRDVCKDGFGLVGEVTAVFLDLPSPWDALEAAKKAMDPARVSRICCFSPSVEQVQRTCAKLNELHFHDIRMYECLVRPYELIRDETGELPLAQEEEGDGEMKSNSGSGVRGPKRRPPPADSDTAGWQEKFVVATRPYETVRGHTSFLTFATLLPQGDESDVADGDVAAVVVKEEAVVVKEEASSS